MLNTFHFMSYNLMPYNFFVSLTQLLLASQRTLCVCGIRKLVTPTNLGPEQTSRQLDSLTIVTSILVKSIAILKVY